MRYRTETLPWATLTPAADGSLAFRSAYDADLVADLKARIPTTDRRWDGSTRSWLVAPKWGRELADICRQHLGVNLVLPSIQVAAPAKETRVLEVRYIGAPKQREDGSWSAFGFCEGGWSVIFPQDVLRGWFEPGLGAEAAPRTPTAPSTLYAILGANRGATADELKRAFRNMAKRWHPDVSAEPDAADMMKRINDAWRVLSDPTTRKRYDAGLHFEESLKKPEQESWRPTHVQTWRPPLRCGFILAEGTALLGRFLAERILGWEDITDAAGRVMVTSWKAGDESFTTKWV